MAAVLGFFYTASGVDVDYPGEMVDILHSQEPVPLSIFRSNSKFDENSECSGFEYTRPITTIFCTRHDSDTVVTCAKYRCDRPRIFYTRVFWIFIEFRIRSKYAQWDGRQGLFVHLRSLSFVRVLCLLLYDDRASCKTACVWWVILYMNIL